MTTAADVYHLPQFDPLTRRTVCAYVRAGYPPEEIADVIDADGATTDTLIRRMRREGWDLRRPRTGQHHVKVANAFLRERYLREHARGLTANELGRRAGLTGPCGKVDNTHIQRLLGLKPMPGHGTRAAIPLDVALALGRALGLDPHEVEAHELRPDPDAVQTPAAAA
jgi:transposase